MQTEEISNSANNKIKLLPDYLVDQIKAGEVVERPSALLKEVLENAIDAHALEISVTIKANGLELILIEDDGEGMSFEDLKMAFLRHTTSKLKKFEDLYSLDSFGFRGEALASAASISRIHCLSSPKDFSEGGKIVIEAGQIIYHQKEKTKIGTSLAIKDLFFNTPARLKFIRGQLAEKNSIKKILTSFLISTPHIKWTIQIDDKEKEIYLPKILEERFKDILKKGRKETLDVKIFYKEYQNINVKLLISTRNCSSDTQIIFVNSRLIEDRSLNAVAQKSLQNDYNLNPKFNFVIFITTPLDFVDVNVHPNKTIVKFQNFSIINSLIYNVCQEALINITPQNSEDKKTIDQSDTFINHETKAAENNEANKENLSLLGSFFFKFRPEKIELINYDQIIKFQISKFYQSSFSEDESLVPLLVALPLKFNSPQDLIVASQNLKNLNIDHQVLEQLILIKGIPSFLNDMGASVLTLLQEFLLIPCLSKEEIRKNLANFLTLQKIKSVLPSLWLQAYLNKIISSLPIQSPYKVEIELSDLQLLFDQLS